MSKSRKVLELCKNLLISEALNRFTEIEISDITKNKSTIIDSILQPFNLISKTATRDYDFDVYSNNSAISFKIPLKINDIGYLKLAFKEIFVIVDIYKIQENNYRATIAFHWSYVNGGYNGTDIGTAYIKNNNVTVNKSK